MRLLINTTMVSATDIATLRLFYEEGDGSPLRMLATERSPQTSSTR